MLNIFSGEEAEGADVYINGQFVGSMQKLDGKGVGFTKDMSYGTYLVEVKKEGFVSFRESITVSRGVRDRNIQVALLAADKAVEDKSNAEIEKQPHGIGGGKSTPICPD